MGVSSPPGAEMMTHIELNFFPAKADKRTIRKRKEIPESRKNYL
jgi:hypothetical protein